MRVSAATSFFGEEGNVRKGQQLEISEQRFRQGTEGPYTHNPLFYALDVGYKMQPPPRNKMEPPPPANKEAAKEGTADPTPSPPDGGQTGAVNAASLLEPDPPRVKRKYTRRAVAPE